MSDAQDDDLVLVTIIFSHFCEKARWALAYHGVPHREHAAMPGAHVAAVKRYTAHATREQAAARGQSPTGTPLLAVLAPGSGAVTQVVQGSADIARWVDARYAAASGRPRLYPEGAAGERVRALEDRFDAELGPAARFWAYNHMLVVNWRWWGGGAFWPWALVGWWNRAALGVVQALMWVPVAPVVRRVIMRWVKLDRDDREERVKEAVEKVESVWRDVEGLLAQSSYLVGDRFTAADLAFASLAYPMVGIQHEEGFTHYSPGAKGAAGRAAEEMQAENRASVGGRHVLRCFAEKKAGYARGK